jgi:3-methyladenine DNA glycosylase AlkD
MRRPDPSPPLPTAGEFMLRLQQLQNPDEKEKLQRYFKSAEGQYGAGDVFMGVKMGELFALAKEYVAMPPVEIERLMESPIHEVRAGAMRIMDKQGRNKRTTEERRKELYELYLRRHDRINNWDLVDLAASHVVGKYLYDKPRDILYFLARSENMWERRTAIVATAYFLGMRDRDDTFRIAELLIGDEEDLIHKAAGGWLRQAGKGDRARLINFLNVNAARMPRVMLRYAIEHLEEEERKYYLQVKSE